MHPIMVLAFVLLAAVALAPVSYLASAPDVLDAGPAEEGEVATPNHDLYRVSLASAPDVLSVDAGPVEGGEVATPNHDPHRVSLMQRPSSEPVATPNHDARRVRPMPSFALNPVTLRAEPEPAAPSASAFVGAGTMLYARDSARLRAAPTAAADVLTKLAADTPLRAIARSTDGVWWRVSLDGGRTGYVHRTAVTQYRVVKTIPPAPASAPVVAVAPPQPAPARRNQSLLGYVDETMNWLSDAAARGSAPTAVRTER